MGTGRIETGSGWALRRPGPVPAPHSLCRDLRRGQEPRSHSAALAPVTMDRAVPRHRLMSTTRFGAQKLCQVEPVMIDHIDTFSAQNTHRGLKRAESMFHPSSSHEDNSEVCVMHTAGCGESKSDTGSSCYNDSSGFFHLFVRGEPSLLPSWWVYGAM